MKRGLGRPQYIQIYESVRDEILRGAMVPGSKLPSIRKFARDWDVSTITIIKAFDKLKAEGLVTTAQRSGFYVSGGRASALKNKKVGFLTPVRPQDIHQVANLHTTCNQLERALVAAGHHLSVHLGRWQAPDGGHAYLTPQDITDYGLDAVIIIDMYNFHYLSLLAELRIPVMTLDADSNMLGIDSVYFDNTSAAMDMCEYLINKDHTEILFTGGPLASPLGSVKRIYADPATLQRLDGCRMAARRSQADVTIHSVFSTGGRNANEWRDLAVAYIEEHPEVTAIVSESELAWTSNMDHIAQAVFSGQPKECSGGIVAIAHCDFQELGEQAPRTLMQRFEDPIAPTLRHSVNPKISYRN